MCLPHSVHHSNIELANGLHLLDKDESPSLTLPCESASQQSPSTAHRRGPSPSGGCRNPLATWVHPGTQVAPEAAKVSSIQTRPPSSLLIGDSNVRHLKDEPAAIQCLPGAKVQDIMQAISGEIHNYPHVRNILVLVATNDTANRQSKVLKPD